MRDKAADDALEKIRKALRERGRALTPEENVKIREVLREIWSGIDPAAWESFSFSKLSEDDIRTTVSIGKGEKNLKEAVPVMADALKRILMGKM